MSKMSPILALIVILFLHTSAPAISNQDFERALDQARRSSKSLNSSLIKPKDGSTIPKVKGIERLGTGKWKVLVNGAWLTSSKQYRVVTYSGVVINHGDRFEYSFLGQPKPKHLIEGIRNHKGTVKAEKAWIKKYKDMPVTVGTKGNRISLNASYSGGNAKDITNRLKLLFDASYGVLVWSEHAGRDVEKNYLKNLKNEKLTYLSKTDFRLLTGNNLSDFEKEHKTAKEGYYDFKNYGRSLRVFNYGDNILLTYHRRIPDSITGDDRDTFLKKVQEYVKKNKVKNAHSQEARWYNPKNAKFVWVRIGYNFDGNLKGEKFNEGYWDFKKKFAEKVDKEISKMIKKYQ